MTKLSQEHNAPNHNIRSLSHHSRKARRPNSLPSGWIRLALLRDGTYLSNYRKLARKFNSKIKRYSKLTGFNALTLDDSKARSLNLFDGINMPRQDSHSISNLTSGYSGTPARNFAPEEQVWVQRRSTSAAVVPSAVKGDFGTIPFIPKRIGELRNSNLIGSSACKNFSRTGTLSKPSPSLLGGKVSPSNANISTESIGGETIMAANNTNMHFVTFNETNFGQKLKDAEKQKQHHVSIHRSRSLDGNFSRRKLKKKGRKKGNKHNKYFLARKLKSFLNDFKSLLLATGNQQVMQGVAEEFYKDITEKSNFHDHGKHNSNAFSKKSRKYKQKYLKNNEKKARSDELISSKNHSHENELSLKEKNQSTDDKLWKYNGEAVRTFSDLYGTSVRKLVGKSALYNATETKRLDKNALLKYISAQNILRSGWNFLPRERNRAGLDRMMNLLRSRLAAMRKAREKNTVGNSTSDKIKGGIANLGMKSSSTIKDSNESSDSSRLEQSEIAGQNRSRVNNVLPSYQITRNDFPQTPNLPLRRISSVPIGLVMNSIQTGSFPKPDIMQKESEALLSMHLVSGSISEASSFGQFQTVPLNVAMSKIDFSAADSLEKRDLGLTSFARIITSSPSFSNMPFASGPSMTSQTTSQILNASLMPLELGSNKDGELVSDLLEAYDFVLKEKLLGPFVPGTGLKAPSIVQGSVQPTLSFSLTNVIRTRSDAKILGKSKPSSIIDTPQNGQPFLDEEAEPRLKEIVPLVDEADQKNGSNNFPIEGKELFLLQNLNNLVHFSPSTSTRMPLAKNPSSLHGFPPSSTTGVPPAIKEGSPGGVSLAGNETDAEIRSVASVVETPSIQESNTSLESQTGQGSNLDAKGEFFNLNIIPSCLPA